MSKTAILEIDGKKNRTPVVEGSENKKLSILTN
jgi:hypothetical protein